MSIDYKVHEEEPSFVPLILGLSAVVAARFIGGMAWVAAALLFFPASKFARSLLNNNVGGMVASAAVVAAYPLVGELAGAVMNKCIDVAPAKESLAARLYENGVISGAIFAGIFILMNVVVALALRSLRIPPLGNRIHFFAVKALKAFAAALTFAAALFLLRYVTTALNLSTSAKLGIGILFGVAVVLSVAKLFIPAVSGGRAANAAMSAEAGGSAQNARVANRPAERLSDVIGMDGAKEQIRLRVIEPVMNPKKAKFYGIKAGGGVLLYGPPGTGKTLLARAVAGELNLPFYSITAADLFGKYVGESEGNARRLFRDIRKNDFSVVFIDELETIFPSRSAEVHETTRKVISLLLQELDGLDKSKNPILLIGATNVPWLVDEAFLRPGRFDVKIFVDLPDAEARESILRALFAKGNVPCEKGLERHIAEQTRNFSGADLTGIVDRMRQLAYVRNAKIYTIAIADEVLASMSPTAAGDMLDRIHDWEAQTMPGQSSNSGSSGVRIARRPDARLSDVVGMDEIKEQIRLRLIEPVRNAGAAKRYGLSVGGGMLLYGPPGTGKTFIARAVAGELDLPFYCVTAADIFGKYVGESERNVRKLFRDIRKNELSVVFIDELETIFPSRSAEVHETTRKVISLLLQELDGLDKSKNPILLIGATNVPWLVDEAFLRPGRFDVSFYVGTPNRGARKAMLANILDKGTIPYVEDLADYLADRTEDYNAADLNGIMARLRQIAYSRRARHYSHALADEAIAAVRPTTSSEIVAKIRRWEAQR